LGARSITATVKDLEERGKGSSKAQLAAMELLQWPKNGERDGDEPFIEEELRYGGA
jgi:hypothetical protein